MNEQAPSKKLVAELRAMPAKLRGSGVHLGQHIDLLRNSADEIERLQRELLKIRDAGYSPSELQHVVNAVLDGFDVSTPEPPQASNERSAADIVKRATLVKYEHGGGRLCFDGDHGRELIADFYDESTRDYIMSLIPGASPEPCVHPWENIGISADGHAFCAACVKNLVKDPPWTGPPPPASRDPMAHWAEPSFRAGIEGAVVALTERAGKPPPSEQTDDVLGLVDDFCECEAGMPRCYVCALAYEIERLRAGQPPVPELSQGQIHALVSVLYDLKDGIAEHATDVVWYSTIQTACDRIAEIATALTPTKAPALPEMVWDPCSSGGLWKCKACGESYCSPPWNKQSAAMDHAAHCSGSGEGRDG